MRKKPSWKYVFLWISIVFFLFTITYKYYFIAKENTAEKNARLVSEKLEEEILSIEGNLEDIKSTIINEPNLSFSLLLKKSKYPYFVFSNRIVIFWSANLFTPKYRDVLGDFDISYMETGKRKYVIRKNQFYHNKKEYEIVFLIPIVEETAVVNKYLKKTYNKDIFTDSNIEITQTPTGLDQNVIEVNGHGLFSVKFGSTYSNFDTKSRAIIITFIIASFLFLAMYIKGQLNEYIHEKSISIGFIFLLSCILILRSSMLLTGFPFDFVYLDIFDPKHYASSLVNPSLGDLFLNLLSMLLLGMYTFNHFLKSSLVKKILKKNNRTQFMVAIVCFFFSFFWLAVHHQTIKTLNYDSQWSMDITQNFEFDYLKAIGYGLFFISVVIYFLFAHVCFRLFINLTRNNQKNRFLAMIFGGVMFFLFALILKLDYTVVLVVNLLFFLIINYFNLPRFIGKIQYLTFIYFFSFGLPGAIIGVYANYQYNQSKTNFNKSRLANQLLLESDYFTELQLADVAQKIKDDIFIQERIFSPYASKLIIEKKIRREYLSHLDKFDIQIYVFNSRGEPYKQFNLKDNYHDLESRLKQFSTETDGLYFINQALGLATTRYRNFIEIEYRAQIVGYILLDLRQKRLVPNSVFPLLLNDNLNAQQVDGLEEYSYGVFANNELQYNYGEFNYRKNLPDFIKKADIIFDRNVRIQDFNHRAFMSEGSRFVVVSSREPDLGARFANFSFLFLVYIFTILLILIAVTIYQSVLHIRLNYAAKIQLYLNFAFFTPLIIVSITTVSIIIQTFKSSLEHQYLEYADNLSAKISRPLDEYRRLSVDKKDLSDAVFQIAEVADLDVNVFHNNGRLLASSLFQIYQNEIISNNIEPRAYIKIVEELESAFVLEEQVGLLNFKNAYVGIRSYETGSIIGILSLPFFASKQDLETNISDVLSNIINIFTFVFIIFVLVSFFVSRGLTFPLRLITQKIRRTTLSSYNEPLSWNSDDEIGLMVAEYNRMLVNLEDSKKALAKSEKESAWREMARQVAHEIKNPLTPMKLTLQHMQRVIDEDGEDQGEIRLRQINTLLEQIETLNDIATSFSDFAKMPAPQMESLDISTLLKETTDLYNKKELGRIITSFEDGQFMVKGDRKWLGRAFSNLILNGFQAVSGQNTARVEVSLFSKSENIVQIEIKDNGEGIPANIRTQVFTPNFSTKYTGSGLGLAIAKKGIEYANGKIWFDSEEGVGTIFYIEIPRG